MSIVLDISGRDSEAPPSRMQHPGYSAHKRMFRHAIFHRRRSEAKQANEENADSFAGDFNQTRYA